MKRLSKFFILIIMVISFVVVTLPKKVIAADYDDTILKQSIPSGYYNSLDLTLSGNSFKEDLYDIISVGHIKTSYGSKTNEILKQSDVDPNNENNIICLYTGQSLSSGWNKEHVWPKSHGFPESNYSSSEPYCDLHHLRPTLISINSTRGNLDFGEVEGGSSDGFGNKWSATAFEPRDEVKGDVARMMFYMEVRYGSKTQFNLQLTNDSVTSGSSLNGRFGNLNTLLKWHYDDPVSDSEIYRNNVVYNYQNNRNPFIDHPEYVDLAYPSSYADDNIEQDKINAVIAGINELPTSISLTDEQKINACLEKYNALSNAEKALVTNYSKLKDAVEALEGLKNPAEDSDDLDENIIQINLNNLTGFTKNSTYVPDQVLTLDGKEYKMSYGFKAADVRLGYNKAASIPAKFNLSNDGSALEFNYDIENVKEIKFANNGKYGTISKWYIMFSTDGGNTYSEIANGTDYMTMEATLSTAQTGRIALIIVGSKPRLVLGTVSILIEETQGGTTETPGGDTGGGTTETPGEDIGGGTTETPGGDTGGGTTETPTENYYTLIFNNLGYGVKPENKNLSKITELPTLTASGYVFGGWYYDEQFTNKANIGDVLTKDTILYAKWQISYNLSDYYISTNLSVNYNWVNGVYDITSCKLNFIINLNKESVLSNAKYYLVLIPSDNISGSIQDSFEQSIFLLESEYDAEIIEVNFSESLTGKIIVNPESFDTKYTAVLLCQNDNQYYFSNETTYSVNEVVKYYLDNNIIKDEIMLDVLKNMK